MPRRPPPPLEEERVEEILLRLAPHQPADLFRASLVCKRWRRLISSPAFRRRYREFHRAPPMLAFLSNGVADDPDGGSRHASLLVTRPRTGSRRWAAPGARRDMRVLDARHGRVLMQRVEEEEDDDSRRVRVRNPLQRAAAVEEKENALRNSILYDRIGTPEEGARELFVSVPMSKERPREVPVPSQGLYTMAAAVLCPDTTGACDHLDCRRGHFLVVLLGACRFATTFIYTYSSETATWSGPISTHRQIGTARLMPSAYVGNALYFGFRHLKSILKYDPQSGQISWIQLPSMCCVYQPNVFATTESGVLGLATIRGTKLYIWFSKDGPHVDDAGWTQPRVIELRNGLTVEDMLAFQLPRVIGFADGIGVIFFWVNGMIRTIDLKTCKMNKFCNVRSIYTLIPYMSFYTPALGSTCTGEEPSTSGPNA